MKKYYIAAVALFMITPAAFASQSDIIAKAVDACCATAHACCDQAMDCCDE